MVKFSLFFTGWALLGHVMFTEFFFKKDASGERSFVPPEVVSKMVRIQREEYYNTVLPMSSQKLPATEHPFDA